MNDNENLAAVGELSELMKSIENMTLELNQMKDQKQSYLHIKIIALSRELDDLILQYREFNSKL